MEQRLYATVEACYRRAENYYQRRFERPRLSFKLRGMAAATAHIHQNAIRFNRLLLAQNTEDFLINTVPHEVSHFIAYRLHGRGIAPHGVEWAAIMRDVFGLEPQRCHQYAVPVRAKKTYRYHCACAEGHALGARRHHSALRGRRYYCRRCRHFLRFAHAEKPGE
ncbi:MAG: SprT family zinc-dependent metalloprotease [Gammaproteobacteria bacterium]|nr:SprT family zinc-dependent metalloprotease [Gammaproteobacteria bacterium]